MRAMKASERELCLHERQSLRGSGKGKRHVPPVTAIAILTTGKRKRHVPPVAAMAILTTGRRPARERGSAGVHARLPRSRQTRSRQTGDRQLYADFTDFSNDHCPIPGPPHAPFACARSCPSHLPRLPPHASGILVMQGTEDSCRGKISSCTYARGTARGERATASLSRLVRVPPELKQARRVVLLPRQRRCGACCTSGRRVPRVDPRRCPSDVDYRFVSS